MVGSRSTNRARATLTALALAACLPAQKQFVQLDGSRFPFARDAWDVAVGDFNRDGFPDVVYAHGSAANELFLNSGGGRFRYASQWIPRHVRLSTSVVVGDVDGDSLDDIVIGNTFRDELYLNQFGAGFRDASGQLPGSALPTDDLELVDMDGDGDRDLLLAQLGNSVRLYLNDGTGRFSDVSTARVAHVAPLFFAKSVEVADFDSDGYPDILATEDRGRVIVFWNDRKGFFKRVSQLPANTGADHVLATDLDGDGDPDVVIVRWVGDHLAYINLGNGVFRDESSARIPAKQKRLDFSSGVAAADIDADGDTDLVVGKGTTIGPAPMDVLLNDGRGFFSRVSRVDPPVGFGVNRLVLVDIDQDQDSDLLIAGEFTRGLVNRHQHQEVTEPVLGRSFTLTASHRPGYATRSATVAAYLGQVALSRPLDLRPVGWLRIDVGNAVLLPLLAAPAPAGQARWVLRVPNDPRLIGSSVLSQGLIAPSANLAAWRLTNLTSDRIR